MVSNSLFDYHSSLRLVIYSTLILDWIVKLISYHVLCLYVGFAENDRFALSLI